MAEKTLEELKAENLLEEQNDELDTPSGELDGEEGEADELDEEHDETGESDDADADDDTAVEDWMKSDMDDDDDGDGQPSGGKFNDSDMAQARRKYKAKLSKKDDELEQLRKQVEELRQPKGGVQQTALTEPRKEDFAEFDDPDAAYTNAMIDYRFAKSQAEQQAQTQTHQRQEQFRQQQKKVDEAVNDHYDRAAELAAKSGITPELYKNADLNVRQMVENVFNPNGQNDGAGDAIVDALIANLGEGSEKVMYNLGRNKARLGELKRRFEEDPSGVKASMYVGQLNAELSAPKKRKTTAPAPAPSVKGDKVVKQGEKALKRAYDKADKAGDAQARFNARREARKAGIDTRNW